MKVQYGTLLIQVEDERAWREYIGLSIKTPKITLCLSETAYESLRIEERTGDIDISEAFAFGTMNISLSTGDVRTGADVEKQMRITASTGDITVENADAGEVILSVSTGKVTLSRVNCAGEMNIHVSTGKIFMTDVRSRSLVSDGTTGDMNLNGVLSAERMHIDRTTGGCGNAWVRRRRNVHQNQHRPGFGQLADGKSVCGKLQNRKNQRPLRPNRRNM